jgi:epoxyqueuosine reductase
LNTKQAHTDLIKGEAKRLGFSYCGISKAGFLEEEAPRLENWLKQGMHGQMGYMENWFDKRLDPTLLVDGAKSVISLLFNYYSDKKPADPSSPQISRYAYGEDYHYVLKDKMKELLAFITTNIGEVHGRAFVDSGPVLDRAWAAKSGLGWIGKNSNLLNRQSGSFFFIAELILDLELEYDGPVKDHCGTCTACIDACPTDAIVDSRVVDGSKCISYFTIELKDSIPAEMSNKFGNWMFGCDICQDVCPWNRFAAPNTEPRFEPQPALLNMKKQDWEEITEEVFKELFKNSAVKRTKYAGLKRNISFLADS